MRKNNLLILTLLVALSQLSIAQSSPQYIKGTDTLVVYGSIPNLPEFMPRIEAAETKDIRTTSDKFTIKVRSVATNNVWVDVLALYTYNRAYEIPDIPMLSGSNAGTNSATVFQHYPNATAGWSQTYGNIEMSNNHPIEVEIAPVGSFKIGGNNFTKATVLPAQKASAARVENGKVYFTISKPGQVAIDINGQMDDYNAFVNPIARTTDNVSSYTIPIHTVTLFANPVIKKPVLNSSRTFYVKNGAMPTVSPSTYDTLYFEPGVHDIGLNNKIYPGKTVYIPGDAIIFGSLNNDGVPIPSGFTKNGERIKIFGYGTISGARIKHSYYATTSDIRQPININGALNYEISGITIADGAHFSLWTPSGSGGLVTYVKVIGWRANGDGLGNGDNVNDCFVRTNDDASYVRGNRKRVTYWKDNISGIFYMSEIWDNTRPILIEDCDILYCRSRGGGGAAWDMRGDAPAGQRPVQVTFRNIRFHDSQSNMTIFHLVNYKGDNPAAPTQVGGNYSGIKFENISIKSSSVKSNLMGCAATPWNGGLTFENVTFAGVKLTAANFATYFNTNQYVNSMVFKSSDYYTLTNTTNPHEGYIINEAAAPNYIANARVILFAFPRPGYRFTGWSGASTATTNPIALTMNANKTITANFAATGTGIPSLSSDDNLTIYPNPATDKLFFNSENRLIDKIQLVDLTGKIVLSVSVQLYNGSVDLMGIARGLYLVKMHTGNNIITKKISVK